jgi:hypothetical protein
MHIRKKYEFIEPPAEYLMQLREKYGEEYIHEGSPHFYAVQVKSGRFKKLMYHYGRVSFDENKDIDKLKVKFEYTILHQPENIEENDAMREWMGKILMDIIKRKLNYEKEVESFEIF